MQVYGTHFGPYVWFIATLGACALVFTGALLWRVLAANDDEEALARAVDGLRWSDLAVDLLPLLGLVGTVDALLRTLAKMQGQPGFDVLVAEFAPALTSTLVAVVFAAGILLLRGITDNLAQVPARRP